MCAADRREATTFLENIEPGQTVFVCGHVRPDGDAIGSVLALVAALDGRGVKAYPLLADNKPKPSTYAWLAGVDTYLMPTEAARFGPADAFIAVDTPVASRLNAALPLLEEASRTLIIDHHRALEPYGDVRYIDESAAACSQIIWQLLDTLNWERTAQIATACYVGLASDTGRFMHDNTTPAVLRDAAEMVEAGADNAAINVALYAQKSAAALALEGLVLERMMVLNDERVTVSWLTQADFTTREAQRDEVENIADLIRSLKGSEVAVFITFGDTGTRVSLRSKTDFDVAAVAERFGGGGHRGASGVTWPDKNASLSDILDAVLPLLPGTPAETKG
ncbi:MAG: DHH family phosphoesterase [Coriobacteriia bacterium]|nr:DHH family phosphoesterase [Coriobacteriia bacterium]